MEAMEDYYRHMLKMNRAREDYNYAPQDSMVNMSLTNQYNDLHNEYMALPSPGGTGFLEDLQNIHYDYLELDSMLQPDNAPSIPAQLPFKFSGKLSPKSTSYIPLSQFLPPLSQQFPPKLPSFPPPQLPAPLPPQYLNWPTEKCNNEIEDTRQYLVTHTDAPTNFTIDSYLDSSLNIVTDYESSNAYNPHMPDFLDQSAFDIWNENNFPDNRFFNTITRDLEVGNNSKLTSDPFYINHMVPTPMLTTPTIPTIYPVPINAYSGPQNTHVFEDLVNTGNNLLNDKNDCFTCDDNTNVFKGPEYNLSTYITDKETPLPTVNKNAKNTLKNKSNNGKQKILTERKNDRNNNRKQKRKKEIRSKYTTNLVKYNNYDYSAMAETNSFNIPITNNAIRNEKTNSTETLKSKNFDIERLYEEPLTIDLDKPDEQSEEQESISTFKIEDVNSISGSSTFGKKRNMEYYCSLCPKKFPKENALRTHTSVHFQSNMKCESCDKTFKCKRYLRQHELNVHMNRTLQCKICKAKFCQNSQMTRHMICHKNKNIACPECGKKFNRREHLKIHKISHQTGKNHQCSICAARFSLRTNLRRHELEHEKPREHQCVVCGNTFSQAASLRLHTKRIHDKQLSGYCPICLKGFVRNCELLKHMQRHDYSKQYTCSVCNKSYVKRGALKTHLRSHKVAAKTEEHGEQYEELIQLVIEEDKLK